MCLSGEFESLQNLQKQKWLHLSYDLSVRAEKDPKGIKWKLKIYSFIWYQSFTKIFLISIIEMATKNTSLNIYVLRSIYDIVSVCI